MIARDVKVKTYKCFTPPSMFKEIFLKTQDKFLELLQTSTLGIRLPSLPLSSPSSGQSPAKIEKTSQIHLIYILVLITY